jgi:uncharacterized protein YdaU (DUF1376 family)
MAAPIGTAGRSRRPDLPSIEAYRSASPLLGGLMPQFPYLPLWTAPWVADTCHLAYAQRGLYHDLLVLMWRTPGCRVPNDDAWLARHLKLSPQEVAGVLRPLISEFCQSDGNWLTQKRLKKEFTFAFERAGRLSALGKRRKNKTNGANGNRSAADEVQPKLTHPRENSSCGESSSPPPVDNPEPPQTPQQDNPARSLATALPAGALTREPETNPAEAEQATEKKPEDMSLAEINAQWRRGPFT